MSVYDARVARWFDEELRAVFGFDIRTAGFAPGPVVRLAQLGTRWRLLVYRTEDMKAGTEANLILRRGAASLLGKEMKALPLTDEAAARRSGPLFEAVRRSIKLPARLLDRIYEDQIVRVFYTDQEIEVFRDRWSRAA